MLLLTADVPSSLILFMLTMEGTPFSGTSVLTSATRYHIPEEVVHLIKNEK
jgi:hypothetical protein